MVDVPDLYDGGGPTWTVTTTTTRRPVIVKRPVKRWRGNRRKHGLLSDEVARRWTSKFIKRFLDDDTVVHSGA